jgi:hypothetical protein
MKLHTAPNIDLINVYNFHLIYFSMKVDVYGNRKDNDFRFSAV